ncbi:LppA family lipoprotein [Saccharomonospora iraqiensis]|uniref:LppA family lipoprotein n=1 Tax=Saccharomonospora iraqiensis TaxID=52698 RepID=UPI000A05D54D|nr:LppA family lipoprotein [Saccharomonospora iraqiensis]
MDIDVGDSAGQGRPQFRVGHQGGRHRLVKPVVVASSLVAVVFASACGMEGDINDDPNAGTVQDQFDTLMQRPSYEDMTERYKRMIKEVQDATVDIAGISEWRQPKGSTPVNGAGCGFDFPDIGRDGGTRQISGGVSEGPIPEGRWPKLINRVAQIAQRYGFERKQVFQDEPQNHRISLFDSYGGEFSFGTGDNTAM